MSEVPEDLKYTKDHEWLRQETDGTCLVGITEHAQESLGDVTFVELPAVGDSLEAEVTFGVVESVKAASDLYMPLAGEVTEVNEVLLDSPEKVNVDPYGEGWMVRIRPTDPVGADELLDSEAYRKLL
ncbi:MAG: glycine cleavage system protein GcvH [Opitutales bacterium]